MRAEIVKLGTMYFDDIPADPGARFNKKDLSIGETIRGWELPWVKDSNRLIADRCVCTNISWHQLNCWGFVFGKLISIEGQLYICRCLRVGNGREEANEWDELMDRYDDDDALWHWNCRYSWGQESTFKDVSLELKCAVRGYHSSRSWNRFDSRAQLDFIGFRPVPEPLSSELPDTFVGKNIRIYGQQSGYISGSLISFDDYDLVLKPDYPMLYSCGWAVQRGDEFIVQRSAILGVYDTGS